MRKGSTARLANGVISACIACFFLVHALIGGLAGVFDFESTLSWVAWIGVAVVVCHVITSIVTSYQQLTDKDDQPSVRKKRHLALKWATGILLATMVTIHIACAANPEVLDGVPAILPACGTAVLAALLAWHICVGMKSLLSDIGVSNGLIALLRGIVCALALVAVVLTFVSL